MEQSNMFCVILYCLCCETSIACSFLAAIVLSSFDLGLSTNNSLITGPFTGLKKTKDDFISGHIIGEDKLPRNINKRNNKMSDTPILGIFPPHYVSEDIRGISIQPWRKNNSNMYNNKNKIMRDRFAVLIFPLHCCSAAKPLRKKLQTPNRLCSF